MRLTELTKRVSLQQLYCIGEFTDEELKEMKKDGWRIVWRGVLNIKHPKKKIMQKRKNGIPIERVVG